MPPKKSRHPIDFTSLDEKVRVAIVDRHMRRIGVGSLTLRRRIELGKWSKNSIWGVGPCFFRKVADAVDFGDLKPWDLGLAPPDWVDDYGDDIDPALHDGDLDDDAYDENGYIDGIEESTPEPEPENDEEYFPDV
eukprot:UN06780